MSYIVLARKYRPKTFADVVGQEVVTRTLQGAIREHRIGHAYLFCGPRGTGKTTLARIFAKALNCEKGPALEPCGECERCTSADRGAELDLLEIDAASNTGVDNVRDLREQAAYPPMRARYKVYIIDEAHQLTKAAFNALLKTLEEPPPHVVFLFATTEPERMLPTVLSRCQVQRLAPIRDEVVAARLTEIFAREGVKPGPGVAEELARRSQGGLRDALSLADRILALVGLEPQLADLERVGAEAGARELGALLAAVEAGDRATVLAKLPSALGGEADLLGGLLNELRAGLYALVCGPDAPHLSGSLESRSAALERAKRLGYDRLERWMTELIAARERMALLPGQERVVLELVLLDLCRPDSTLAFDKLGERLAALERALESGAAAAPARPSPAPAAAAPPAQPAPAPTTATVAPVAPVAREVALSHGETWKLALEEIRKLGAGALADALGRRGRLIDSSGTRVLIQLDSINDGDRRLLSDARNREIARRAFHKPLGRDCEIVYDGLEKPGAASAGADPFTKLVAERFGGRVEER